MYILFTGAPGSKWSSVAESIYWSDSIDHTDSTKERGYNKGVVKHIGAYWDPGMEFENTDWDGPFSGKGKRIIKSHTFAHTLDALKQSGHPIVMVYRNDYECFKWWSEAGGFGITYPNYKHFQDLDEMWIHIQKENKDILQFIKDNKARITSPMDNVDLCRTLEIDFPDTKGRIHNYAHRDTKVYVYS
jgi:hypothetical protein|tara:strand:- start:357 stop:920 length:564 start_codon:yes stop_codon:yes gene_type:complete